MILFWHAVACCLNWMDYQCMSRPCRSPSADLSSVSLIGAGEGLP